MPTGPITPGNIREGWVLGNRLARVRLDGPARREAMALDPRGRAVADPHGLALSPTSNGWPCRPRARTSWSCFAWPICRCAADGPGDHLEARDCRRRRALLSHSARRPADGHSLRSRGRARVRGQLPGQCGAGGRTWPSARSSARSSWAGRPSRRWRGAARRSFTTPSAAPTAGTVATVATTRATPTPSRWTPRTTARSAPTRWCSACATCGTRAPGSGTAGRRICTRRCARAWPKRCKVRAPTDDDVRGRGRVSGHAAAAAQLAARSRRQPVAPRPQRGQQVFESAAAGCATCHSGPYFTDGEIHDVGLASEYDKYDGYNTPSLVGIGNRAGYLHHGRAKSLDELLTDLHSPAKVSGTRELTPQELADLVGVSCGRCETASATLTGLDRRDRLADHVQCVWLRSVPRPPGPCRDTAAS